MGAGGPTPKAGPAAPGVAGAYRRRYVEIDDCQIQNPAYSFARVYTKGTAEICCSFFSFQFRTDVLYLLLSNQKQTHAAQHKISPH